jgi:hypothetical protein
MSRDSHYDSIDFAAISIIFRLYFRTVPTLWYLVALGFYFFFQLKYLFEIFTFVSKRNMKYQYLILASLILVACNRNSVSHFSTIQLSFINKFNTDFESYFLSVSNVRLVCLFPIFFRFWPTCWEVWKIYPDNI